MICIDSFSSISVNISALSSFITEISETNSITHAPLCVIDLVYYASMLSSNNFVN